jgi:AcrR family transcriptional regulator
VGRREDNKEKTRQEILDTALRLFHAEGFDATRVQDIIEPVGISEKTFFNYFPSKQAVLDASALETLTLYEALLEYEIAFPERTVVDRIHEIVDLWAQNFAEDREFFATVTTRTSMFFGSSGEMRDLQKRTQHLLAELLHQGQRSGELRPKHDPLQLAETFMAIMMLTTINWLDYWWEEMDEPLKERLERATEIFLNGAAAHSATKSRNSKPKKSRPARQRK